MKAAVLGAGVMGAALAGHLANSGISTILLDVVPLSKPQAERERNQFVLARLDQLRKEKPPPLYHPDMIKQIQIGNIEDDLTELSRVDWIIEAAVEQLAVKKQLWKQVESVWTKGTVVSTSTSGISVEEMTQDCSKEFRKYFLGTHFFNPPRYMHLVEIIPTPDTDWAVLKQTKQWLEDYVGKGVVIGKDTPLFIAKRIQAYDMQVTFQAMQELDLSPDEVDAVMGEGLGRFKSATFRTLDFMGLDTYLHMVQNAHDRIHDPVEKQMFIIPSWLKEMVDRGWLGQKAGRGFYQKRGKQIFTLDLTMMTYRPRKELDTVSLRQATSKKMLSKRLQTLIYAEDVAGQLAWQVTKKVLLYAAEHLTEIADDIVSIDQAMKWGGHWPLGPFELWDAIGVAQSIKRMRQEGERIPPWIETFLQQGHTTFYQQEKATKQYDLRSCQYTRLPQHPQMISLKQLKADGKLIKGNKGASLIDLGDRIACLEFHSSKGAIDSDVIYMIHQAIQEVEHHYHGLVIGNQNLHFCVGANLSRLLMEAQDKNWLKIDQMCRQLQDAMTALRYLNRPVVAAPFGRVLGGGVEICLAADHIQALAESYMGLVETAVGLIPAAGGIKEMLIRWTEGINPRDSLALHSAVNQVFQIIRQAQVSTGAIDARSMKIIGESDRITIHPGYLLYDAKQIALDFVLAGYRPPLPQKIPVVGESGYHELRLDAYHQYVAGYISEYDYHIASKLAYVVAGGNVPAGSLVSEQRILDLEREAVLSLISEPKTQARMQYMLRKKKPLRN